MTDSEHSTGRRSTGTPVIDVPETVPTAVVDGTHTDVAGLRAEVAQLHEAMDSRAEIEQARGMLMALASCSAHDAWLLLVEISQHSNVKVRALSTVLVAANSGERMPPGVEHAYRRALALSTGGAEGGAPR